MTRVADLRAVPLFAELSDSDLRRVAEHASTRVLTPGEVLFSEGETGDMAYVIVTGEVAISKRSGNRDVPLATRAPGEVIGEMALLQDSPRSATARAAGRVELIAIPRSEIDELLATSAEAVRGLFRVLLERWQSTQVLLAQSERMAQLGTLTAGLAHELNNPAAAVTRSAGQLRAAIDALTTAQLKLGAEVSDPGFLEDLRRRLPAVSSPPGLDAIARADLEAAVEERLIAAGVSDAWSVATALVDSGVADHVEEIVAGAGPHTDRFLATLLAEHDVASLLHTVEEGTRRLSVIVRALKSYSYLDRDTVQTVDLAAGLDDTLLILRSKLRGIEVRREFHPDLPTIEARGGELNQVWTNIIDNAAYAIAESGAGGTVTIRAFPAADGVVVEVEDDGPGIPAAHRDRVFDSFFTTKPPGEGTGVGLSISYDIVVNAHRGDISVDSRPGRTVFTVWLPLRLAD